MIFRGAPYDMTREDSSSAFRPSVLFVREFPLPMKIGHRFQLGFDTIIVEKHIFVSQKDWSREM
jgi:hypothetical protein